MSYQCRMNLKQFGWLAFVLCIAFAHAEEVGDAAKPRTIKVVLVLFDSVPEKVKHNLDEMQRLTRSAVKQGARWVIFHEDCLGVYTAQLNELANPVPDGPSCQQVRNLRTHCSLGVIDTCAI